MNKLSHAKKLKWTKEAEQEHKKAYEELKARGFRPVREITDPECESILTYFVGPKIGFFLQTFVRTGDCCFFKAVREDEL